MIVLGVLTWKQAHIYADQETLWQDTLARNPACWMAHINLANVLNEKGQVDQAIHHYQEALRLQPNNADAHYNIGTGLLNKGQTDAAITEFREALRAQPDHVNAHINLGFALLRKGQVAGAISMFREALRLKPNDPLAHANLGVALEKDAQFDEAISEFQAALRLKPDDADLQSMLARARELKRGAPRTRRPSAARLRIPATGDCTASPAGWRSSHTWGRIRFTPVARCTLRPARATWNMRAMLITGPPFLTDHDAKLAKKVLHYEGRKAMCGGTTANIVVRALNRPVRTMLAKLDPDVPPAADMEGVDLA
jgi:tetratricopeptide (TPR) repeat protein